MKAEPDKTDKNMITITNIVTTNNITLKKRNSMTRAIIHAISMANTIYNEPTLVLNNVDNIVLYLLCFLINSSWSVICLYYTYFLILSHLAI
jgi:hypothetical protein